MLIINKPQSLTTAKSQYNVFRYNKPIQNLEIMTF